MNTTFQTALQQGMTSAAVLGLILIFLGLLIIGLLAYYAKTHWTEINEDKDRSILLVCLLFMSFIGLLLLVLGIVQMFTLEYVACMGLKTCLP